MSFCNLPCGICQTAVLASRAPANDHDSAVFELDSGVAFARCSDCDFGSFHLVLLCVLCFDVCIVSLNSQESSTISVFLRYFAGILLLIPARDSARVSIGINGLSKKNPQLRGLVLVPRGGIGDGAIAGFAVSLPEFCRNHRTVRKPEAKLHASQSSADACSSPAEFSTSRTWRTGAA
jgi:hypothetical protein